MTTPLLNNNNNNSRNTQLSDYDEENTCTRCEESVLCCTCFSCCTTNRHAILFRHHLISFYIPNFGQALSGAVFSTILPVSLRKLGESDSLIGLAVALVGLGRVIAEVPVSMLSHRLGSLQVMMLACFLATCCYTVPAVWLEPWAFFLAQGLGGVPLAGFSTPRLELMQFGIPKAERNILSSHMGAGARSTYVVGPVLAGLIYHRVGEHAAYALAACFLFVTFLSVTGSRTLQAMDNAMRKAKQEREEAERIANATALARAVEHVRKASVGSSWDCASTTDGGYGATDDDVNPRGNLQDGSEYSSENQHRQHHQNNDDDDENDQRGEVTPQERTPERQKRRRPHQEQGDDQNDEENNNPVLSTVSSITVPKLALPASPGTFSYTTANEPLMLSAAPSTTAADAQASSNSNNNFVSAAQSHDASMSVWATLKQHAALLFGIGFLALSVTGLRAARRLALTFRALNLYNGSAQDVGYVLAASFGVDSILFWVCSFVANKWGFRAAMAPLCMTYAIAYVILSFDDSTNPANLYVSGVVFGLGDSLGAGLILSIIGELVPRQAIGAARVFVDVGLLVGPLACGGLSHRIGLSWCCRVLAIWSFVAGCWSFVVLPANAGREAVKEAKKQQPAESATVADSAVAAPTAVPAVTADE